MIFKITKNQYMHDGLNSSLGFGFLYNNVDHPVICEGWHFKYMWKPLTWPHHFNMRGGLVPQN